MTKQDYTEFNSDLDATFYLKDCVSSTDIEPKEWDSLEEAQEALETFVNQYQIIYYNNAMDFLAKVDPSLNDSIAIAIELDFSLDDLNSEVLATLLFQQTASEELQELLSDHSDLFEPEA